MGVLSGPFSATRVRVIESINSSGNGVPRALRAASPARILSHLGRKPAASTTRTTASVISSPTPSPGINVTTLPRGLTSGFFVFKLHIDANGAVEINRVHDRRIVPVYGEESSEQLSHRGTEKSLSLCL